MNLQVDRVDDRRLEVVANGLPLWNGQQLAVDTTLVSPLSGEGVPNRRGGRYAGATLALARRRKERAYPELLRSDRCRLVVLAVEVGGRWSEEAASFVRALARAKAREAPARLRASAFLPPTAPRLPPALPVRGAPLCASYPEAVRCTNSLLQAILCPEASLMGGFGTRLTAPEKGALQKTQASLSLDHNS